MPDGRLNLVARGTRPFRIEARQDELAYPAGVVEFLFDREEEVDPEAAAGAHDAYAALVEQATDRPADPDGHRRDVVLRDGRDGRVRARRQAGAARPPLGDRADEARARLCRAAIKRLDFVDRAQARARSNGKVHFTG